MNDAQTVAEAAAPLDEPAAAPAPAPATLLMAHTNIQAGDSRSEFIQAGRELRAWAKEREDESRWARTVAATLDKVGELDRVIRQKTAEIARLDVMVSHRASEIDAAKREIAEMTTRANAEIVKARADAETHVAEAMERAKEAEARAEKARSAADAAALKEREHIAAAREADDRLREARAQLNALRDSIAK